MTNVPEFTVGVLAQSLKKTLEDTYARVRVRGELSRVSIAASGHMYSSLKDADASIDLICWKGALKNLSIRPEEGLDVICTGRITTYPQRSNYQLIIDSMELAGEGALLKMLEERKKRLAAEGLFAPERKKALPFLPETIGVITSPTGAVIRDILHRLSDRFPRHVLLWPAMVQGEAAAQQVAAAINGFQTIDTYGIKKPDLLIVARGGGSLEDLMPFNEEIVVRAIAKSAIPVISAIGHETDTTLADYAADRRAPTPTGAAEMAVPVRAQLAAQIMEYQHRALTGLTRAHAEKRHRLEAGAARLGDPSHLLETKTQRLDHMSLGINSGFQNILQVKERRLTQIAAQLRHPREILQQARAQCMRSEEKLESAFSQAMRDKATKLNHTGHMLKAYSFKNVLERGYTVIRGQDGALISAADALRNPGTAFEIEFKGDQRVKARTL